jgi:predicted acyltransferase
MISQRIPSVDYFRGFILFLLAAESTGLYNRLNKLFPNNSIIQQFFHVEWQGLHFWDLIQPGFMMIAGAALYFSTYKKLDEGATYLKLWPKVIKRSIILFLFGTGLHCLYREELVFELWNVLTQLSVTTIIAFFLLRFSIPLQIAASLLLLLLSHSLYVFTDLPGFDEAYTPDKNFGSYMDLQLMGKLSGGHWIAINFIPTAAHTIWGCLLGRIIHRTTDKQAVLRTLFALGAMGVILGYGLDWAGIPIIKRTATLSFTLASGGWISILLGFFYLNWEREKPLLAVSNTILSFGKNSIFIYLFFESVGPEWLNKTSLIFVKGIAEQINISADVYKVINSLVVLALIAMMAKFMDKKKVYISI